MNYQLFTRFLFATLSLFDVRKEVEQVALPHETTVTIYQELNEEDLRWLFELLDPYLANAIARKNRAGVEMVLRDYCRIQSKILKKKELASLPPLTSAIFFNKAEAVSFLLEEDKDLSSLEQKDVFGLNPLMWAVIVENEPILKMFLAALRNYPRTMLRKKGSLYGLLQQREYGDRAINSSSSAKVDAIINASHAKGHTAYSMAESIGRLDFCQLLRQEGAYTLEERIEQVLHKIARITVSHTRQTSSQQ